MSKYGMMSPRTQQSGLESLYSNDEDTNRFLEDTRIRGTLSWKLKKLMSRSGLFMALFFGILQMAIFILSFVYIYLSTWKDGRGWWLVLIKPLPLISSLVSIIFVYWMVQYMNGRNHYLHVRIQHLLTIGGVIFGGIGDVILIIPKAFHISENQHDVFFILGLVSFLIGHMTYLTSYSVKGKCLMHENEHSYLGSPMLLPRTYSVRFDFLQALKQHNHWIAGFLLYGVLFVIVIIRGSNHDSPVHDIIAISFYILTIILMIFKSQSNINRKTVECQVKVGNSTILQQDGHLLQPKYLLLPISITEKIFQYIRFSGSIIFGISDTLLSFRKFQVIHDTRVVHIIIMSTYYAAQWMITLSSLEYLVTDPWSDMETHEPMRTPMLSQRPRSIGTSNALNSRE